MAGVQTKTGVKDKTPSHDPETGEVMEDNTGEGSQALAPAAGTEMTAADEYAAYMEDAGAGFENQTGEDVSIPFLNILQPGSPLCQEESSDAKPGFILNSANGHLVKGSEGVTFIPSLTRHVLVEWIPRTKGGGYVGEHLLDSELARRVRSEQQLGKYEHPDTQNDLIETFYVYGVALASDGQPFPAVMAYSSTHIKPYKDWMFKARSLVIALPDGRKLTGKSLPLWSHAYSIRTMKQEKNGYTWFVPVIGFAGANAEASRVPPSRDVYKAAKAVHEAVSSGALKADASKQDQGGGGVDEAPRAGSTDKEKAPY